MRDFWKNEFVPVAIATIVLVLSAVWLVSLARSSSQQAPEVDFKQAADQARWPNPEFVSNSLVGFKFDHPVEVVTWTQKDRVSSYQSANPTTPTGAPKDVWVTVVPYLKAFCQEYVRSHGTDSDQLALRLKEHLGLPPDANYDTFVELTVDPHENGKLFRPCGDPSMDSLNTTSCKPPSLPVASDVWSNPSGSTASQKIHDWMLRKYYSTYATEKPYPWTALGYTFDWARKSDSGDFERFGESEFVIPKDDPIHFVSAASTTTYCTPP